MKALAVAVTLALLLPLWALAAAPPGKPAAGQKKALAAIAAREKKALTKIEEAADVRIKLLKGVHADLSKRLGDTTVQARRLAEQSRVLSLQIQALTKLDASIAEKEKVLLPLLDKIELKRQELSGLVDLAFPLADRLEKLARQLKDIETNLAQLNEEAKKSAGDLKDKAGFLARLAEAEKGLKQAGEAAARAGAQATEAGGKANQALERAAKAAEAAGDKQAAARAQQAAEQGLAQGRELAGRLTGLQDKMGGLASGVEAMKGQLKELAEKNAQAAGRAGELKQTQAGLSARLEQLQWLLYGGLGLVLLLALVLAWLVARKAGKQVEELRGRTREALVNLKRTMEG